MLRSMYAAISGLKNFQTQLDVIGNNIANVNTFGYKKSRVNFQDIISQQISGASAPTFNKGGINPVQVGLGSTVGSIDNIQTQGNLQTTGRSLDSAISGDGYFTVQDGFNQYYTRAGNFYLDAQGNLVTSGGQRVLGYGVNKNGVIDTNSKLVPLSINQGAVVQPETKSLSFTGNIDDANNMVTRDPSTGAITGINSNYSTPTPITFKAFDRNHNMYKGSLTFSNPQLSTDQNTNQKYVSSMDFTLKVNGQTPTGTSGVTGTVTFDNKGAETGIHLNTGTDTNGNTNPIDFSVQDPSGNSQSISIKPSDLDLSSITARQGVPSDAKAVGDVANVNSYSIGSDGIITAVLSNGQTQSLGQLALTTFNNPGGLKKEGNSLYSTTSNSGAPSTEVPGSNGAGTLQAGALEMSNVDLAEEFTGMIDAQRGFQANAKTITTADQVLQTLINLKQ